MQKDRIVWVDVMRGFSMILVVLGYVLMVIFRMPLFSFRADSWWTRMITALSLLVSQLLRQGDTLAAWLFGEKNKKQVPASSFRV